MEEDKKKIPTHVYTTRECGADYQDVGLHFSEKEAIDDARKQHDAIGRNTKFREQKDSYLDYEGKERQRIIIYYDDCDMFEITIIEIPRVKELIEALEKNYKNDNSGSVRMLAKIYLHNFFGFDWGRKDLEKQNG